MSDTKRYDNPISPINPPIDRSLDPIKRYFNNPPQCIFDGNKNFTLIQETANTCTVTKYTDDKLENISVKQE